MPTNLQEIAEKWALALWDVISGDCFGMTPDPWVCDDEANGTGCMDPRHECRRYRAKLAIVIANAVREREQSAVARALEEAARDIPERAKTPWTVGWLRARAVQGDGRAPTPPVGSTETA